MKASGRGGGGRVVGLSVLTAAAAALGVGAAWGGPARYDPRTRSIAMTYTYAALAEGVFGEAALGAPQTPTAEQDASVRTIVLKVSDALSKATAGRLRISSLDLVPDVRRADVVISLTGDPGRGGWAIAGAIEGRPGQIGLYYRTLAKEWEQDYVLTAAHEVCHYVFGFVDEYVFPRGCPPEDPGGPGCLMDNYLSLGTRHGWYGRFCDDDHDPHPTQRQSCQEIADRFFRDRGVAGPADANTDADPASTPTVLDRDQSIIDQIAHAAIGKVREEAEALHRGRRGGRLLSSISALRGFARSFLEAQLARNGVGLSSDEMGRLVEFVLKQSGRLARVAIPPQFGPLVNVIAHFADLRAKQLREKYPRDSELTRRQKLMRALLAFVSGLGASAPTAGGAFTDDERRYLEHVAALAVAEAEADEPRVDHELYEATLAYVKLQRDTARNVLDIASEVGVVGIERRLAALGEVDADLRKYLPGRTASSGFGLRRTIIVDPDPVDPRDDFVVTQSGIARYADLRDQYVGLFQKLVERARVELLTTELQQRRARERRELLTRPNAERARAERLRRIAELADPDRVRAQREADLRALVDEVVLQVRRNRLENIVFLVPPGGLGTARKSLFETLRRQLIVKADVRLDLVLVGAPDLPFELRDAAVRTGGSVVTLSDVDEVGAVAQRLKNDQTSGCWVIVPRQGVIRGRYRAPAGAPDAAAVPWLLDDPRRGPFLAEPIEPAFREASLWLDQVDAYFRRPAGAGGVSPAEADMLRANVMPRVPVGMLCDAVTQALHGTGQGEGDLARDQAAMGLRGELGYLRELVIAFNHRAPGADELGFEIVEHLIRARSSHHEVKSLLESALKAHQSSLAPDYQEDQVFQAAHDRLSGPRPPIPPRPIRAAAPPQALVDADPFARVLQLIVEGLEDQADRFVGNAPTLAHIRLKQQEARLRLVDDFLRRIEDELAGSDAAPIFQRIDRKALVLANQRIQDNAPVSPPAGPGAGARRPLPPVDTLDEAGQPRPDAVRLPRFRAEDLVFDPNAEPAEFELILGLARSLPLVDASAIREHRTDILPELRLYNDDGQLVNTPTLELDRDLSTPSCLVYRFRPEFGETGWYTAALILKDATFSRIGEPIDYTFSVASTRPNVRITAAQVQAPADPELTPPPPNLGLARVSDRRVKLEVQVYGGTSVLGASVRGVLHKLDGQTGTINPIAQDFHDDGKTHGDAKADDGVYTSLIALDQIDQGKEYRVLIQAESTEASRNIPPEDPARNDPARRAEARAAGDPTVRAAPLTEVPTPQPEKALIFQRATSIQFRVER